MYEKIQKWYAQGLWKGAQVAQAVQKGLLTADQYRAITGKEAA